MSNPKIKHKFYFTNMGLFHEIGIISWIKTDYSDTRSFGKILNDLHDPLIIIKIKCTKLHLDFTNYYKSGLNKKDIPDYK